MAEHPNVQLLRRAMDAFMRGDTRTAPEIMLDDVVYHFPGRSVLAGDHKGVEGVLAFFAEVARLSGGSLKIREHDVLATERHGVALLEVTAKRGDRELTWRQSNIYHLRDGKIAEAWLQPEDQRVLDEFLA